MPASSSSLFAVLTGDIIRSQALSGRELESVRRTLLDAVDDVRKWRSGVVKGKAEFFRGDAWQVLLSDPQLALRVALFLRATLLGTGIADTRVAPSDWERSAPFHAAGCRCRSVKRSFARAMVSMN